MRYYELLYIVNPNLEDDRVNNIIDEIGGEVKKYKVSIVNHYVWGKKRLAYPIKSNKYGIYILLQFSAEQFDFLIEFERFLILNKSVIRHQVVRLDEEPAKAEEIKPVVEDELELEGFDISEADSTLELKDEEKIEDVEESEKADIVEEIEDIENVNDNDEKELEGEKPIKEKKEENK